MVAFPFSCECRRAEEPPTAAVATQGESAEVERERGVPSTRVGREEREKAAEQEDDSEEAKEAAEEARMRQRALAQLQAYQARNCSEAIAKITELLRTKKGRWLERNDRGQIPSDLVQTLVQAELWGSQSESLCQGDPARSHLDDLRNLMATIWQYPRSVPRAALEERLRVLG